MPDGTWVARHALSVLFTDWPPGPLALMYSYFISLSLTVKSKGTVGITTIDIVDEWSRPFASV